MTTDTIEEIAKFVTMQPFYTYKYIIMWLQKSNVCDGFCFPLPVTVNRACKWATIECVFLQTYITSSFHSYIEQVESDIKKLLTSS